MFQRRQNDLKPNGRIAAVLQRTLIGLVVQFVSPPLFSHAEGQPAHLADSFEAGNVVGYEQCVKCHSQQITVLKQHPHFAAERPLHRRPQAIAMAKKLGFRSVKRAESCVRCHYTPQQKSDRVKAVSGISCESCHGPASQWILGHNDYGGPNVTKTIRKSRPSATADPGKYWARASSSGPRLLASAELLSLPYHRRRRTGQRGAAIRRGPWASIL